MNKTVRLLLFAGVGFEALVTGCVTNRYNLISECEEQMVMFPNVPPYADSAKTAIAPLGAEALLGRWHGDYIFRNDTYDGRMAQSDTVKATSRFLEDYEFLPNGEFRVMVEICCLDMPAYYGSNIGRNISKFSGRWKYCDGKLTLSMDGEGSWDSGDLYHRKLTKLSEILPDNEYIVDWFSNDEILLRRTGNNVSYDEFGRESEISRMVKETRNGEDYGCIFVSVTGSKILRKVK